ncbi:hypothetical protein HYR69_00030 [Candidatus Sumerlaeota bacterium]|nr:hypothetical protein [Candidatus Sumerlaeota bacterium]
MSRFQLELATPADDAALRRVLAATPMDGRISLSFRREPSYFDASVVDGRFRQVVVGRDQKAGGEIIGFGSRSVRDVYVNGERISVGYLSALRLLPEYRGWGNLIARGFAHFKSLHNDGRAPLYLTTIAEGNERAIRLLTSGRAGLPTYHFAGLYHTAAIPASSGNRALSSTSVAGIVVRSSSVDDLPQILEFVERNGRTRQFFPVYSPEDFFQERGAFKNLHPSELLLAFREGRLIGTFGGWDQCAFRQSVVHAYSGGLRMIRPFYNALAPKLGKPRLPGIGEPFHYLTGALPLVENDDEIVFGALLRAVLRDMDFGGAAYLMLGLHERDPLLPAVRRLRGMTWYTTRLYQVCWEDGEEFRRRLDARPPYLELGSL